MEKGTDFKREIVLYAKEEQKDEDEDVMQQELVRPSFHFKQKLLHSPFYLRIFILLLACLSLSFFCLAVGLALIFKILNILTCALLRPLHKWSLKIMRLSKWLGILFFSCLLGFFSPSLGMASLMSLCLLRSYDFPEKWMRFFMKVSRCKTDH